ncbi:MAG: hypothetical protein KDA37_00750 [Planctomycetales bacterium]|nr:hypothetical protein [Planctomycetales bacterium]
MQPSSLIVIAVDGLRASALGAYGNTWYGTRAIDRLASDSTVFDQFLLDSHGPETFYDFSQVGQLAESLSGQDYSALLVTDSPAIRGLPMAGQFDRVCLSPMADPTEAASEAVETAGAATLALMLDQVEQTSEGAPVFVWTHLRFAAGPWDAPPALVEELLSEEDPEIPLTVDAPSSGDSQAGDDEAFLASARYAAQVLALDACLGAVAAALDELRGDSRYTLALLGVRGCSLGEHGRLRIEDTRPYAEMRHAPLIVRTTAGNRHRRVASIATPADLCSLLVGIDNLDDSLGERAGVLLRSPEGDAWQNDEWKLVTHLNGPPELYSKPDDRWEVNDVAVRHEHVVEELQHSLIVAAQKK